MPRVSRPRRKYNGEFALYRGDEFIDIGTKKELAKLLGIKTSTLYRFLTPSYAKRQENCYDKRYFVVALD